MRLHICMCVIYRKKIQRHNSRQKSDPLNAELSASHVTLPLNGRRPLAEGSPPGFIRGEAAFSTCQYSEIILQSSSPPRCQTANVLASHHLLDVSSFMNPQSLAGVIILSTFPQPPPALMREFKPERSAAVPLIGLICPVISIFLM